MISLQSGVRSDSRATNLLWRTAVMEATSLHCTMLSLSSDVIRSCNHDIKTLMMMNIIFPHAIFIFLSLLNWREKIQNFLSLIITMIILIYIFLDFGQSRNCLNKNFLCCLTSEHFYLSEKKTLDKNIFKNLILQTCPIKLNDLKKRGDHFNSLSSLQTRITNSQHCYCRAWRCADVTVW